MNLWASVGRQEGHQAKHIVFAGALPTGHGQVEHGRIAERHQGADGVEYGESTAQIRVNADVHTDTAHRTLSHFAARLSQLPYRRLHGWLHRAIRAAHINRKILVDCHVSRHGDGQARRQSYVCINGNEDSSWQGDLCFYAHDGIEWDVHCRPVLKQRHPHRGGDGHITLETDREPFGILMVSLKGITSFSVKRTSPLKGIVCVIGNSSGGAPGAHVASSCASTWSITVVAWARARRSSMSKTLLRVHAARARRMAAVRARRAPLLKRVDAGRGEGLHERVIN